MPQVIKLSFSVPEEIKGQRIDQFISKQLKSEYQFSRNQIQNWIKNDWVLLDGAKVNNKTKVYSQQIIQIDAQIELAQKKLNWQADDTDKKMYDLIYEDDELLIINKYAGVIVHPGAGNSNHTLINQLIYHYPNLNNVTRYGIIHRIDKDTTGLICIAKTDFAYQYLSEQILARTMIKKYIALVNGVLISGGKIDQPIARSKHNRLKKVVHQQGKKAITLYKVMQKFTNHTLVECELVTGRTHQIRVHLSYIDYPIVGDLLYLGRKGNTIPKQSRPELIHKLQNFKRQALHSIELTLIHPKTKENMTFKAYLPSDLSELIELLSLEN